MSPKCENEFPSKNWLLQILWGVLFVSLLHYNRMVLLGYCHACEEDDSTKIDSNDAWLDDLTNSTLTEVHTNKKRQGSTDFYGAPWAFVAVENKICC